MFRAPISISDTGQFKHLLQLVMVDFISSFTSFHGIKKHRENSINFRKPTLIGIIHND